MNEWQPIEDAPRDGTIIEVRYDHADDMGCLAVWSYCPTYPTVGAGAMGCCPPGWATAGDDTDKNLPIDPPDQWRPHSQQS